MKIAIDLLFITITLFLAIAFSIGVRHMFGKRRGGVLTGLLILLLGVQAFLAHQHVFDDFSSLPPRIFIIVVPWFLVSLILLFLPMTSHWVKNLPQATLSGIQAYRIPVEFVLWGLFAEGIIPEQMTFEGRNFDIISGILGGIIGLLLWREVKLPKFVLLLWNIIGIGLLFNILAVAILSTPSPLRYFMNEPANTVVAEFPYIWLPGFVAPMAFLIHVLSIRKALSSRR
ncbi:MAG: hypothetical protein FD123_765 [Bacteroidetes bacterium]|nr:MAG: hypothetical protein FD123_765 [Bacteroidota bacterium]